MMRKISIRKKIVSIFICVMLVCIFTGCGNNGEENDSATNENDSTSIEKGEMEEDYKTFVELVETEEYAEALNFLEDSCLYETSDDGYSDTKKYSRYARAMRYYNNSIYGNAYDFLSSTYCKGFLDSETILQEIDEKVGYLDGVYMNKSVPYDGMYAFISHGMVKLFFGEGPDGTEIDYDNFIYGDSLCDYTFTTGEQTFAIGNFSDLCEYTDDIEYTNDIDYIMTAITDDSFVIGAPVGSSYDTFSGAYEKTDLAIPVETQNY